MKILLDTHILLWAVSNDVRLPAKARKLIENEENEIYYSLVSLWEVEIKHLAHPDAMTVSAEDQAAMENMMFVTHDSLIPGYNEPCILAV